MTADLVWGARAIADFLRDECGLGSATPKMVYHWAERSVIPIAIVQRKLVISRAAVLARFTAAIDAAVNRCQAIPMTEDPPPAALQAPPGVSHAPADRPALPREAGSSDALIITGRARGPRHRIR